MLGKILKLIQDLFVDSLIEKGYSRRYAKTCWAKEITNYRKKHPLVNRIIENI